MEKFLKWCSVTLAGSLLTVGIVSTLMVPVAATDGSDIKVEPRSVGLAEDTEDEIAPTFVTEMDDSGENVRFRMGRNLLLAGNNIKESASAPNGLMLVAGNTLELSSAAEYGFLAGNIINYSGETTRDLFIAGNYVTLRKEAQIGRDTYITGDTLIIETDLSGDLAAATATIELRNITVAGNVNLNADSIKFTGNVEIKGALTYNETAEVTGLEHVTYSSIEIYEVREVSQTTQLVTLVYSKIISVAALFIIMAIICAVYPKLHDKISKEAADANRFGIDLALGFGALLLIPIVAVAAFISFIVAPLGLIAIALYVILIYLSQGFAGAWLGHLIMEKGFKAKGNIFAEAFIGIFVLGLLALIPYVGILTGFLGLLLGLGLILQCIKPVKETRSKISAKFETESKGARKQSKPKAKK